MSSRYEKILEIIGIPVNDDTIIAFTQLLDITSTINAIQTLFHLTVFQ